MKDKIDKFIKYFTAITKEECDYIEAIVKQMNEKVVMFNSKFPNSGPVLPEKPLAIQGRDGIETFKIDENTIGVRPKWISIKDRLPEPYDFVLVFADNQGTGESKPISIARFETKEGDWEFCNHFPCMPNYGAYMDMEYAMDSADVTHWMPLPDHPKKQDT